MLKLRPVDPDADLSDLENLFEVVTECDGHAPIGEHKYLDLLSAGSRGPAGLVATLADEIVGYVAVGRAAGSEVCALEPALHPLHRSPETIRTLVEAGIQYAVADCGGSFVRIWAFQPNYVEVLLGMGFREERELRQLRRPLPTRESALLPEGIRLAPFRPGRDEETWLAVNNAAFAGHPENGSWTREVLADRLAQPWFDAEGFLMAWEADDLAGFCWTKRHADTGEIYVIAVAPSHQGRSLGRALVLAGLESMHTRGMTRAMLYVDAGNRRGIDLYESLGFRLDHIDRSLIRAV